MQINIYPIDDTYGGDFMRFCIRPSVENIPAWYKNSASYLGDPKNPHKKDRRMTMKRCMPIYDYLSTGLSLYTPFSIYAEGKYPNREIYASLDDDSCKLGYHAIGQKQQMPLDKDYDDFPRKIDFPYYIETPPGYSALYIASKPYDDFPLFFPNAVVQVDKYKAPVNFPFFIKKDFEGKIDSGTEFMKIFFVKREEVQFNYKTLSDSNGVIKQYRSFVGAFGAGFYKSLRLNQIFD